MAKDDKVKAPPAVGRKDKEEPAAAPQKKKKSRTTLMLLAAVLVLLPAGGGAAWWLLRGQPDGPEAGAEEAAKPQEKPKPAIFLPLETFTVNLQPEEGERYLQTTVSLRVADGAVEQSIKGLMPEIRSRLLMLLSSKKPSELASTEGKQALANQIATEVNGALNPGANKAPAAAPEARGAPPADGAAARAPEAQGPVLSVLFTNFIIQ